VERACHLGTKDFASFPEVCHNVLMQIIYCDESYAEEILAILNEAILNTTALYDYQARSLDSMASWFAAKRLGNFPVLGAVDDAGTLLGFASYGAFRNYPANKYTVEHSLYLDAEHRGRGIGRQLLTRLIAEAESQDLHLLVGGIDSTNTASIALHRALGFEHAGTIRQIAYKFGRWLDLEFYQLILKTPLVPLDGEA
jgi:phosphinothricin acetyltransferase